MKRNTGKGSLGEERKTIMASWKPVQMNRNAGMDHWEKKMDIETLRRRNGFGASPKINGNGVAM